MEFREATVPQALEQVFRQLVESGATHDRGPSSEFGDRADCRADSTDFGSHASSSSSAELDEVDYRRYMHAGGAAAQPAGQSVKEEQPSGVALARDFFRRAASSMAPRRSRTMSSSGHAEQEPSAASRAHQRHRAPSWTSEKDSCQGDSPRGPLSPQASPSISSSSAYSSPPYSNHPSQPPTPSTVGTALSTPSFRSTDANSLAEDALMCAVRRGQKAEAKSPKTSVVRTLTSKLSIECTAPRVVEPVISEPFDVKHEHHIGEDFKPLSSNMNRWVEEVAEELRAKKAIPYALPLPPVGFVPVAEAPKKSSMLPKLACGSLPAVAEQALSCAGRVREARRPPGHPRSRSSKSGQAPLPRERRTSARSFFSSPARKFGKDAVSEAPVKAPSEKLSVPPLRLSLSPERVVAPRSSWQPRPVSPCRSVCSEGGSRSQARSEMAAALRELRRFSPAPIRTSAVSDTEDFDVRRRRASMRRASTPQPSSRRLSSSSRQPSLPPLQYSTSPTRSEMGGYRRAPRVTPVAARSFAGDRYAEADFAPSPGGDSYPLRLSLDSRRLLAARGRHSDLEVRQRPQPLPGTALAKLASMPTVYQASPRRSPAIEFSGPLVQAVAGDGYYC